MKLESNNTQLFKKLNCATKKDLIHFGFKRGYQTKEKKNDFNYFGMDGRAVLWTEENFILELTPVIAEIKLSFPNDDL